MVHACLSVCLQECEAAQSKASKFEKLKESVKQLEQKLEEKEATIEELKQQNMLIVDSKGMLEEQLSAQQTTADKLSMYINEVHYTRWHYICTCVYTHTVTCTVYIDNYITYTCTDILVHAHI